MVGEESTEADLRLKEEEGRREGSVG